MLLKIFIYRIIIENIDDIKYAVNFKDNSNLDIEINILYNKCRNMLLIVVLKWKV